MPGQVIGLLRYSVVTARNRGNWYTTREATIEEAVARIFDDRRMRTRSRLFRQITLAWARSEWRRGVKFRLVVLVSPLLPRAWREDLDAAVTNLPKLHVVEVMPTGSIPAAAREAVAGLAQRKADSIATFRIDDDDCLATGTIDKIAAHTRPDNIGKALTFENGIYCGLGPNDDLMAVGRHYRSIALGLSYISHRRKPTTIFNMGSHSKIEHAAPLIVDSTPGAWLRSIHGSADTAARQRLTGSALASAETASLFETSFGFLDRAALREAYLAARGDGDPG